MAKDIAMKKQWFFKLSHIYKKQIALLFLLGLLSSVFFLLAPYFSRLFIDKAFINKDFAEFLRFSVWGAGIFIFSTLFKITEDIARNHTSAKLRFNLAAVFIKRFYLLDLVFFQDKSIGENAYRFSGADPIINVISDFFPKMLVDVFKLIIMLCISFYIDARLTALLFILSPLFLLHSIYFQKKLKAIYAKIWESSAKLSREVYSSFSKIIIIKSFNLESHQRRLYLRSLIENIRLNIKGFRWATISSSSAVFLSRIAYGLITLYGGWLITKSSLTLGSYAAIMIYLTQIGILLQSFGARFEYFAQIASPIEKFYEVIDGVPEIKDEPSAINIVSLKEGIRFKDISFGYQRDKLIFDRLNLFIPEGEWAGLTGPSGSGKTTLINLILRLYDPFEGEIILGRLNFKNIKIKSLRSRISIAAQEPFLFDLSIRENISYGLNDVSINRVTEAANIACLDDFISGLSAGYDTVIGENACKLSQGLKQRVSLARAIVRNPDLLILDEATSSVDFFTEEKILKKLREQRKGLSTIVISHRLSSIKDADRIYFLKQNGLIEQCTHDELMLISQPYKDFLQIPS